MKIMKIFGIYIYSYNVFKIKYNNNNIIFIYIKKKKINRKLCIKENKSRNEDVLIFLINEKSIILNKFIVKSVVTMRNPDDYSIYKSYCKNNKI